MFHEQGQMSKNWIKMFRDVWMQKLREGWQTKKYFMKVEQKIMTNFTNDMEIARVHLIMEIVGK